MNDVIEVLKADFARIDSNAGLHEFARKYALVDDGVKHASPQVYGSQAAEVGGVAVRITHRWYDPSGPFQNLPDVAKVALDLDGVRWSEIAYDE